MKQLKNYTVKLYEITDLEEANRLLHEGFTLRLVAMRKEEIVYILSEIRYIQ